MTNLASYCLRLINSHKASTKALNVQIQRCCKLLEQLSIQMLIKACIHVRYLTFTARYNMNFDVCTEKLPTPPQCECQHLSQRTLTEGTIKHKLSIIRGEKNLRELSRTNTLSTLFRIFTPGRGKRVFGVVLRKIFFMPSANWKCQKVAVLFLDRINFKKSHRYRTAVPRSIVELRCNSCEWKSLVILCRSYVQTM